MRTEEQVQEFKAAAWPQIVGRCKKCDGTGVQEKSVCPCERKFNLHVSAYEACIPQSFWKTKAEDVTHNKSIFDAVVLKYVRQFRRAKQRGYGLMFLGDNGVGKTMFISYVLSEAIRNGWTTYYTTMPQLDFDIKSGFKDNTVEQRLQYMLTSDFLAIDEMGKERRKANTEYMDAQVERILKQRFDDAMPTLIATNMDQDALVEAYGPTVESILIGHYMPVQMNPGDFREKLQTKMQDEMGYSK